MEPYYESERAVVYHGDCLDVLRELPEASVDAVVTDPPYDLTAGKKGGTGAASVNLDSPYGRSRISTGNGAGGFMGKAWDATGIAFDAETWRLVLRVLKPGGHLLAFGGTRTWHRLACAIEDAGFEIRDNLAWLYGSGFPKSLDVSKAIDRAAGAERKVEQIPYSSNVIMRHGGDNTRPWMEAAAERGYHERPGATAATPDAARWQGWGTALKPAYEPIVLARKPLAGTVAANVLAHGTGALNVGGCRIQATHKTPFPRAGYSQKGTDSSYQFAGDPKFATTGIDANPSGRWPANVVLDEAAAAMLDEQSGTSQSRMGKPRGANPGDGWGMTATGSEYDDLGGASRFFYTAKAGSDERPRDGGTAHPTVKPLDLMRWLVRLVTPPGGTVLEPFAGSGTTVEACLLEGFRCVAIERETDYLPLVLQRIQRRLDPVSHHVLTRSKDAEPSLFDLLAGEGGAA